ncbi:MAG TPA: glucoamylase family protein, partial [Candidatus Omnitrophota bacterium]|nr:glucoamylase family protein [Candidatus Omnitrophota bacterium]
CIRRMLFYFDMYGEYGFYDSVNVKNGKVSYRYLALDQGMILPSIDNYLNNGAIRQRFHKDPVAKKVEKLLNENFFE